MKSARPIGSEFEASVEPRGTDPSRGAAWAPDCAQSILFSSGSDAIYSLLKGLEKKGIRRVLLPSYFCEEMLHPIKALGLRRAFYKVDDQLRVDMESLEKATIPHSVVFVIHYFGFRMKNLLSIAAICRRKGAVLVEDCVQAPFTLHNGKPLGRTGAFSFNSYRKVLPVPDGALLCINTEGDSVPVKESSAHKAYVRERWRAMRMKRDYLERPEKELERRFKESFKAAETLRKRCHYPSPISRLSKSIIARTDIGRVVARRRRNYAYLFENISRLKGGVCTPLFPLEAGVCPLGFPVVCRNRDDVKRALIAERIYPPIHWRLTARRSRFPESYRLSKRILTLPIDQRYTLTDMRRIVEVLRDV